MFVNRSARRKLEEAVKAMMTSLPLVLELRHPAMRTRHWRQLMQVAPKSPTPAHVPHTEGVMGEMHAHDDMCKV